jgi:predicted RNase H-like nuclease (RuvC/YqgF family)
MSEIIKQVETPDEVPANPPVTDVTPATDEAPGTPEAPEKMYPEAEFKKVVKRANDWKTKAEKLQQENEELRAETVEAKAKIEKLTEFETSVITQKKADITQKKADLDAMLKLLSADDQAVVNATDNLDTQIIIAKRLTQTKPATPPGIGSGKTPIASTPGNIVWKDLYS